MGLKISGGKFVSTKTGQVVQLRGANTSGAENSPVQGYPIWTDGGYTTSNGQPPWSLMASWGMNAVRIPLNSTSWLNINGGDPTNGSYPAEISSAVANAQAAGLYVILDLHWDAPGSSQALAQNCMLSSDNGIAFWKSVASYFMNNPGVIFEAFNEPYVFDPAYSGNGCFPGLGNYYQAIAQNPTNPGNLVLADGGSATINFSTGTKQSLDWTSAGYQQVINTIRATGATNIILVGGQNYTDDLMWITGYPPSDPLQQIGAAWHMYQGGWPFLPYEQTNAQLSPSSMIAGITALGIPVVITETQQSPDNTWLGHILPYADSNGFGVIYWCFDPWGSDDLISNGSGTPTTAGLTYQKWLKSHTTSGP